MSNIDGNGRPLTAAPGDIEVVTAGHRLDELAEEWDELYRVSPTATPFLSHGWLSAYWHAFGDPTALRVVCVRDTDRRLLAAAALRLRRRPGLTILTPIAAEISDYSDVLVHPTRPDAHRWLVGGLLDLPGWDVLDASEVAAGATLTELSATWPGPTVAVPASTCLDLPAAPVEQVLAGLPAKTRGDLRRKLRQADELGLRCEDVPADATEIAGAVADLLDLHARQWAGRPVNATHLTDRYRRHLTIAAQRLVPAGQATLTRHVLAGSVVAVSMALVSPDTVAGYLYGVDPALTRRVDVTAMMIRAGLELAGRRGAARLSLLRGTEPAKLRWRPRPNGNQRLLLLPPGSGRGTLAGMSALLSAAGVDLLRRSPRLAQLARTARSAGAARAVQVANRPRRYRQPTS